MRASVYSIVMASAVTAFAAGSALLECRDEARLPAAGLQFYDFRPDSIRSWSVGKAVLYLHLESGTVPERLAVSTVAQPWSGAAPPAPSAAFGKSGAVHGRYPVRDEGQGWIAVTLDPKLVAMLANGSSQGFAVREQGRRFSGRRPVQSQPYLLVEGE